MRLALVLLIGQERRRFDIYARNYAYAVYHAVSLSEFGIVGCNLPFGDFHVIMMTARMIVGERREMHKSGVKIYFDGGCRPNPGQMETAVVVRGVTYHQPDCGHGTNNDAEWLALIHALEVASAIGATDIVLLGDSAVVVGQATGATKCRSAELQAHLTKFQTLAGDFKRIRVRRVGRNQNLAGIALARTRI